MDQAEHPPIFDYRTLRLLMGAIAFAVPFVVLWRSAAPLESISAAYCSEEARDAFVGMLCVVGACLWVYRGHFRTEAWASKVAGMSAVLVAFFPTCVKGRPTINAVIHYGAAFALFAVLIYFCFGPFRKKIKGRGGRRRLRSAVYLTCGTIMAACILGLGAAKLTLPKETLDGWRLTFWAEAIALWAFGVAWMVAGKCVKALVDDDEEYKPILGPSLSPRQSR